MYFISLYVFPLKTSQQHVSLSLDAAAETGIQLLIVIQRQWWLTQVEWFFSTLCLSMQ